MKQSFIFLDIDGPINPDINKIKEARAGHPISSYHIRLPNKQLQLLQYIVQSTSSDIVLSSKWRLVDLSTTYFTKGEIIKSPARINLEKQLKENNLSIYDETPFIGNNRGLEIKTWLDRFSYVNGYDPAYVIIDDNIDNIVSLHRGHSVNCDGYRGIGFKEATIAINLICKQLKV